MWSALPKQALCFSQTVVKGSLSAGLEWNNMEAGLPRLK